MQIIHYFETVALFSTCDFEYVYGQRGGKPLWMVSLSVVQNEPETRITIITPHRLNEMFHN